MDTNIDSALIKKETLSPGTKYVPLTKGTRVSEGETCIFIEIIRRLSFQVKFHYQTKRAGDTFIIDDSRKCDRPMELVLGKQFKLEVWEVIVQKMALNEVAKFTVDKSLVQQYLHLKDHPGRPQGSG